MKEMLLAAVQMQYVLSLSNRTENIRAEGGVLGFRLFLSIYTFFRHVYSIFSMFPEKVMAGMTGV